MGHLQLSFALGAGQESWSAGMLPAFTFRKSQAGNMPALRTRSANFNGEIPKGM
jgi:hypothetical protein